MADISTMHKTLDLRAQAPAAAAAQPATQLHGNQVAQAGGAGVLDLRPQPAQASQTAAAPATTPAPAVPVATPSPLPKPSVAPAAPAPASAPVSPVEAAPLPAAPTPGQIVTPPPAAVTPAPAPDVPAQPATLSPAKVARPITAAAAASPTPSAAPLQPTAPTTTTTATAPPPAVAPAAPQSPMIQKFPAKPEAAQATQDAAAIVGAQIDAMSAQAAQAPAPPAPPQSPALQQALAAAKQSTATSSVMKIATAVAALGLMAGVVWLQNSPKLAFHDAAVKAGIDATLPTYIPSNYHQDGPVSTSAGQLSMNYASPDAPPLKIQQRQTSWDTTSLRDNYVSQQTDSFLAIQGQGLTIYVFNNEADWVNHGVWYQVTGTSKLSRDQILRIAYGL